MRAYEFMNSSIKLHFFGRVGMISLMEAYRNPDNELNIEFDKRFEEFGAHYYQAKVKEKASGKLLLLIDFVLRNDDNRIDVGNIYPILPPNETGKQVHTTSGSYEGGMDMGHSAMKWIFKQIKEFAVSQGFNINSITTSTRYTGIRAKNDPDQSDLSKEPKHYSVTRKINESMFYDEFDQLHIRYEELQ